MAAPVHPVPQLQAPFEESMLESVHEDNDADTFLDPITRRNLLLEAPSYQRVVAGRWRQKPGERFHPLWKLIAQISFGVHLLAQNMAKSEDDVMQILQAHVDEIDGFLERTTEDFDLAAEDIQERLRCLKLPLSHPATFDKMLEDRNFRLSIVEGNEKIEHIVERTTQAMKDSLKDVQKGFDSTSTLETYLQGLTSTWQRSSVEHEAVFVAMIGNVEGWRKAFLALHVQGNKLGGSLKKLTDIINEMQARAGEVSRRLLHQAKIQHHQVMGRPTGRSTPTSRFQAQPAKQLPSMPRPPLRQAISNDTVRSAPPMRTSSQDSLRHQALLARSQTPQDGMPATRQVNTGASPRIVQIESSSQPRVQSMVPSLLGAESVILGSNSRSKAHSVIEDPDPERTFPPIELPAHVPEETMQKAPMSKQNRFSLGLKLAQDMDQNSKADKRTSKFRNSALIDLLRSNPVSSKSNETSKSRSPEHSRRTSTSKDVGAVNGTPSSQRPSRSGTSPGQSSSTSDHMSSHTKNNISRPKKGIQHWFDAEEIDSPSDDKFSVHESGSPKTTVLSVPAKLDQNSQPGTPAWAVTTFAQVEKKKELLRKGAFSSHPPELPPGSPPLGEASKFTNPMAVVAPRRKPSHSSSVGQSTLGEPGPEVPASDAGSAYSGSRQQYVHHRASQYAPELVVNDLPPPTVPNRQFVAEMEGSSPAIGGPITTSRHMVMELEAPQQHFVLPPRPQKVTPPPRTHTMELEAPHHGLHQPHFVLPPRPNSVLPSPKLTTTEEHETQELVVVAQKQPAINDETRENNATSSMTSSKVIEDTHADAPSDAGSVLTQETQQPVNSDDADAVEAMTQSASTIEAFRRPILSVSTPQSASLDVTPQIDTLQAASSRDSSGEGEVSKEEGNGDIVAQYASNDTLKARLPSTVFVSTPNIPIPPSPFGDNTPVEEESLATAASKEPLYILPALTYKAPPLSPRLPPDPVLARRSAGSSIRPTSAQTSRTATPTSSSPLVRDAAPQATSSRPASKSSSRPTSSKARASPKPAEYDPSKVKDNDADPFPAGEAKRLNGASIKTQPDINNYNIDIQTISRERKPLEKINTNSGNRASNTTESWKAFFTGQPSPVGSTLSIKSIRRESLMVDSNPGSQLSPGPRSPIWFSRNIELDKDDSKRSSGASAHVKEVAGTDGVAGLGISTEITSVVEEHEEFQEDDEKQSQAISATV